MTSGVTNNNLPVMMPLSSSLVFCRCAILLVSFEGIVCSDSDFFIENFSMVDIYSAVEVVGSSKSPQFLLTKDKDAEDDRQRSIPFSEILYDTLIQEANNPKVISFYTIGEPYANYNIKFQSEPQASYYFKHKALPANYTIRWARIYSNWLPAIINYEYVDDNDIGFKLLDHENYPNLIEHIYQEPYFFKRSDIENLVRRRPPHTLYLRSTKNKEDYEIMFRSTEDLEAFLELLPDRVFDDDKTMGYYFMPGICFYG